MGEWSTQRTLMAGAGAALAVVLIAYLLASPSSTPSTMATNVNEGAVNSVLLAPGPLPEMIEGAADAKVTVVEYASMSCPHCAAFHNEVLPEIRKTYIDTGKVRLIFREFPLNRIAVAAAMLPRCISQERSKELVAELFRRQNDWLIQGEQAVEKLYETVKQVGFTKASFEKCLDDKALYDNILAVRTRADQQFGVHGTPAFFVNGKRYNGAPTLAGLSKEIEANLK